MKKAGIISLYYNSVNYGGLAQAFALNQFLLDSGYDSELISYNRVKRRAAGSQEKSLIKKLFTNSPVKLFFKVKDKIIVRLFSKKYSERLKKRYEMVSEFRNSIPHSEVLTEDTISSCENRYDIFISGSDQIWKPGVVDDGFVFNFLNSDTSKTVFSYASSVSVNSLSDEYISFMSDALKKYKCVSLREAYSVEQFKKAFNRDIYNVVDPVLLLDKSYWYKMSEKRLLQRPYLFCYLLGENRKQRKQIKKYAKTHNLELVTIPHIKRGIHFEFKSEDLSFGDNQMFEVGMPEFLSLIRYADTVITDSFHAGVFSYIFKKDFFLLERPTQNPSDVMNVRIYNLLDLYDLSDRLVRTSDDLALATAAPIDYDHVERRVEAERKKSLDYIRMALNQE